MHDLADSAWEELWGRPCHQGTVNTASYVAIPYLADLALRFGPVGYDEALALAAAIVGSRMGPRSQRPLGPCRCNW
jgi:hypothetical protein